MPVEERPERPWRIHPIIADFTLEDVWRLPVTGDRADFADLVELMTSGDDLMAEAAGPARLAWTARDRLGGLLRLGRISAPASGGEPRFPIPGTTSCSLVDRLPDDLRGSAADIRFTDVPMVPLYLTTDEFAAELSNRTVHAVMHLGWVPTGGDRYEGRMTAYVKPRGALGRGYMASIRPIRRLIVFPALLRQMERAWSARPSAGAPARGADGAVGWAR